jgi:hypothetical protein
MKKFVEGFWEGDGELPENITPEENDYYEAKAKALASKYAVSTVYPVVQIDKDTFVRSVCFLKEPNYVTKLSIMDKSITIGVYHAAEELRTVCLLAEESDAITFSESSESDRYKLGVVNFCLGIITALKNQFQKKI